MTLAEDRVVAEYQEHGFRRVVVRHDEANFAYPNHYHPYNLVLQILSGSMFVTINHQRTQLSAGDHGHIRANQLHSVKIGAEGCTYIHAEKDPAKAHHR